MEPWCERSSCLVATAISSDRGLARADVVPMHGMPRVRPSCAPACRPSGSSDARLVTRSQTAKQKRRLPLHRGNSLCAGRLRLLRPLTIGRTETRAVAAGQSRRGMTRGPPRCRCRAFKPAV